MRALEMGSENRLEADGTLPSDCPCKLLQVSVNRKFLECACFCVVNGCGVACVPVFPLSRKSFYKNSRAFCNARPMPVAATRHTTTSQLYER